MGIDCKLITDKNSVYLDRQYTFCHHFSEGKIYDFNEFIELIFKEIETVISDYREEKFFDSVTHDIFWLKVALENASKKNMIVSEHDDRYYEDFLLD